ncbi:GLPGLI family protein [Bizionia sp. KMM 8389]
MNKLYKLLTITGLALLSVSYNFAQQDFQGVAYYQTKTTMNMDNFGGRDMNEQRKKQIMERMKDMLEKTYILTFTQTESTYKEEEKLDAPGSGGGRGFGMMSSFTGGEQYKNVKEKQLLQEQEFFGKQFLVVEDMQSLDWELSGETRQIGQYTCFKATAVKKSTDFDFASFGRGPRGGEAEKKEKPVDSVNGEGNSKDRKPDADAPKEIMVTAWYTPQIPVNNGPGEYWGLPGLILEINADRTTMLCSKIILNPSQKTTIKKPTKGKKVSREEYNTIVKEKTEEMREMYGGRGGRGGGRGR